jgi:hypothetical protein
VRNEGAAQAGAASCRDRTRGRARVWHKVGDGPDGHGPPGGVGEREADWAAGPGEGEAKRLAGLGRMVKKRKGCWAGPCGRKGREGEKKKERVGQLDCREKKKKGEEEKEMGRAKREREGEKEMHLKFKYKWKTSNKIMQYDMICARPIFPYISFHG